MLKGRNGTKLSLEELVEGDLDTERCFDELSPKSERQMAIKVRQAIEGVKEDQDEDESHNDWD